MAYAFIIIGEIGDYASKSQHYHFEFINKSKNYILNKIFKLVKKLL